MYQTHATCQTSPCRASLSRVWSCAEAVDVWPAAAAGQQPRPEENSGEYEIEKNKNYSIIFNTFQYYTCFLSKPLGNFMSRSHNTQPWLNLHTTMGYWYHGSPAPPCPWSPRPTCCLRRLDLHFLGPGRRRCASGSRSRMSGGSVDQWINSGSIVDLQLEVAVQVPYQIY